jgi:hypothetical protein
MAHTKMRRSNTNSVKRKNPFPFIDVIGFKLVFSLAFHFKLNDISIIKNNRWTNTSILSVHLPLFIDISSYRFWSSKESSSGALFLNFYRELLNAILFIRSVSIFVHFTSSWERSCSFLRFCGFWGTRRRYVQSDQVWQFISSHPHYFIKYRCAIRGFLLNSWKLKHRNAEQLIKYCIRGNTLLSPCNQCLIPGDF